MLESRGETSRQERDKKTETSGRRKALLTQVGVSLSDRHKTGGIRKRKK